MDKCFNCGAAVRPGAKFCTSCGTRLIDNPAAPPAATGETQVATPATTPETSVTTSSQPDDNAPFTTWRRASSGWNAEASTGDTGNTSPADRFEAGLDAEKARRDEPESDRSERDSSWGKPAPTTGDRFASWSSAYGTGREVEVEEPAATTETGTEDEGEVVTIESATIASSESVAGTTDSAGFTDDGGHEVDVLSGDENIAAGGLDAAISAERPNDQPDARGRATTLVEELRELIWKIGEQEPVAAGDMTDVRNALSAARGQTSDFTDLERAISAVRESPRDIDALLQLGSHAGRLEELLESHARLTSALDEAIGRMQ